MTSESPTVAPSASAATAVDLSDLARQYEPERYLAATLAPEPARAALIALAAYAADLARIAATATQPLLGEIRLQWWRDSLDILAKGHRIGSPHADALGAAMAAYGLPAPMLAAMSEARAWDLYDDPMPDQAALDGYLAKTEAIPFELALRVLGVAAGDAGRLGLAAGRVFGMSRLLAQLPPDLTLHLAAGRLPLPLTLLAVHKVSPDAVLSGAAMAAVQALISEQCRHISGELATLRPQLRALSRRQRTALLPLAVVPSYLKLQSRRQRHPARDIADLAPLTRVWRIAAAHMLGRF